MVCAEKIIRQWGFRLYAEFTLNEESGKLKIPSCTAMQQEVRKIEGIVYIWLVRDNRNPLSNQRVAYIGSTSRTANHRRCSWQSGISGGQREAMQLEQESLAAPAPASRGSEMGAKIREELARGNVITYWIRVARRAELFGVDLSLFKSEEDALISLLHPEWNFYKT